ncbi:MAG TPA: hypothetical protein DCW90_02390 [Lachnospiraceae bacterium]|nr:hypothetical protein [Lachnospiraceae bacterium]
MAANVIKIKELPIKPGSDIGSKDIMLIEDTVDTKQITIEDLQIFFSSDKKITALKDSLEKQINDLSKELDQKIKDLESKDSDLKKKVEDLYNDHENTKRRLGDLIEKVTDISNLLDKTIDRVSNNEKAIKNLQDFTSTIRKDLDTAIDNINKHGDRLTAIETKNTEQDNRLAQNEKDISDLDNKITYNINRIDNTIANNATNAKTYSDQLYDQIMKYIDYYHHYHEDPPNFDDPYGADTKLMNTIFKIGAIYETVQDDFNPKDYLPGDWEYAGDTYVYDMDGNPILRKHTYIRRK